MGMNPHGNRTPAESGTNGSHILGRDLQDPKWMCFKAIGFVVIGLFACTFILLAIPRWDIAAYLALAIWSFARAYYFAFYVIERYVDPTYRFDGIVSAIRHLRKLRQDTFRNGPDRS
jgi:hypothetical protein